MIEKPLLVGSVFAGGDAYQQRLMDIQIKFLLATTKNFKHVTVLNSKHGFEKEERTEVISRKLVSNASVAHLSGLKILHQYFTENVDEFEDFLFLDSDAFPIRKGWRPELKRMMGRRHIAMPIRYENFEQRLHSSILFAHGIKGLGAIEFHRYGATDSEAPTYTLMGKIEGDINPTRYDEVGFLRSTFPLLRSNRQNYHPLWFGVYYDMFYHHQCASLKESYKKKGKGLGMRAEEYWTKMGSGGGKYFAFSKLFHNDPASFIRGLAGWNPGQYPTTQEIDGEISYPMWERDELSFRKADKSDLNDLMVLKMQSWDSCHRVCFLNPTDQAGWFNSMVASNPSNMIMMVAKDDVKIGAFKIFNIDWISGSAEIGWDLYKDYHGQGLGGKMVKLGVRFCEEVMNLRYLSAEILENNVASASCAKNAGMKSIGVRSGSVFRGEYLNSEIFEWSSHGH